MNITLFISRTHGGGAERVTCNLANYLSEKGHTVEILVMSESKDNYFVSSDVKITPLLKDTERKNRVYNAVIRILRLHRYMRARNDVDRYIVMLPITIIMMLALHKDTKAKIIASERNDPTKYSFFIKKALRYYAKRADGFVFQTSDALAWYIDSIAEEKTKIIPNAINPAFLQSAYTGKREKRIIAVGRLNAQKNFQLLIDAFGAISGQFPDYTLSIFGEGSELEKLKEHANEMKIGGKVSFPGYSNNMPEELGKSMLFVLTSNYEGMPNALMEAMAMGLPCISTDCPCGGPRFLIEDGKNGLLVPVGDVKSLAEAIQKMLTDKGKAESIAAEAMKVREVLNPNKVYALWEKFVTSDV